MKERLDGLSKETLVDALSKFLGDFCTPAFGSMPKREIELAVFELLQSLSVVEGKASLYELMTQLRITRAKAAQLLFDIEVRRLGDDELKSLLAEALVSPRFAKDGEYFVLEIENPLVHAYLKEKLRQLNHVSDTSFNSALIRMPVDAVSDLIADQLKEKQREAVRRALVAAGAPDTTWKGVLRSALKKLGAKIVGKAADGLVEEASEYLKPIVHGASDSIQTVWSSVFAEDGLDKSK
ncbi:MULTISPECIES: hypothetical protein [unclassified Mameliella]|uniref:hypothetical protein n=1 Tax=unclassified Mameliella TaxID=2630630 RepID=UPI00273DA731|nr:MULTISPECIES: hypothetical protein [unclassified Mameliella]